MGDYDPHQRHFLFLLEDEIYWMVTNLKKYLLRKKYQIDIQ